jgi:hypothetical protein
VGFDPAAAGPADIANIATTDTTQATALIRLIFATSYLPWRSPVDRSYYYSRDYLSGGGSGMGKSSQ